MKYISLFAGIGCADVAWAPLGWEPICFSEIDPFASAVLAHRFPGVPNVGDVTKHDWSQYRGKVDLVIGGFPCQSHSVAGQRKGLDDPRGQLTLEFARACNDIDPAWIVGENVPGILSVKDAFGSILGELAGASGPLRSGRKNGRWPNAGLVVGPRRAVAFGIIDAQEYGVPQRRKRVFLVAVALSHPSFAPGKAPNPAAVFFKSAGLLGNSSTGREAGEEAVAAPGSRVTAGGGHGADLDPEAGLRVAGPLCALTFAGGAGGRPEGAAANHFVPCADDGLPAVSGTLGGGSGARGYANSLDVCGAFVPVPEAPDAESGNGPGPVPAVTAKWSKGCGGPAGDEAQNLVVYPLLEIGKRTGPSNDSHRTGAGIGNVDDPMFTLQAGARHGVVCGDVAGTVTSRLGSGGADDNDAQRGMLIAFHPSQDPIESTGVTHAVACGSSKGQASIAVAFSSKDSGADEGEVAPTLRAMGHDVSHMNGGGQVAVAISRTGPTEIAPTVRASPGGTLRPEASAEVAIVQTVAGDVTHTLRAEGADASEDGTGRGTPVVAIHQNQSGELRVGNVANTINTNGNATGRNSPLVMSRLSVRRLTPRECERLQGLPDDWTLIPHGKGRKQKDLAEMAAYYGVLPEVAKTLSADSLRYKACGNGMAVPVMWWLGKRIEWVLQRLSEWDGTLDEAPEYGGLFRLPTTQPTPVEDSTP